MSLILDALNRARQERGETGPAALPTTVVEATTPGPLVPVLALALVLAAVIIAWLAWERWGAEDDAPGAAAVRRAGPAPAARVVPPPEVAAAAPAPRRTIAPGGDSRQAAAATAKERSGTVETASDPAVAALYADPPGKKAAAAPETALRAAATRAAGGGAQAAGQAEAQRESAPSEVPGRKAAPAEEAIDIEAVVARARKELGEPALAPHPAPLLADLSQQQKDAIPTLMYLRHDYVENGTSTVLINGETRRVGDRIGAVQVEEILRDSVVLRHRDTLFRLRALNSWVNL
ncbi:general secretion pathway protein GspB [Pseudohaliea sp.]|uniref:general secretion pathway protein GspB n=1 Tax=Pseudohaliea sp. TaxID=2740289 RepID=UPI0032EE8CF7